MTRSQEKELKHLLREFKDFLKESLDARESLLAVRDSVDSSIKELDELVKEQRQATIGFLGKFLSLEEGDEVSIADDGSYSVRKIS